MRFAVPSHTCVVEISGGMMVWNDVIHADVSMRAISRLCDLDARRVMCHL